MSIECPVCGSEATEANTFEAWCYECDWWISKEDNPAFFAAFREAHLARTAELAPFFDRLLAEN